jgi:prepilin-type N-terminal cleavage/methylation domain-containing protein
LNRTISSDNRGLTLVELIIGLTVLAIIVVPLLNVFAAGAATAMKSRAYDNATISAQNIVEQLQSSKTDSFLNDSTELLSGAKYYTASANSDGTTSYTLSGTSAPVSADKKYYIGVNNVTSGGYSYDALITLDANLAGNNTAVSVSNKMDALLGMTGADDTALSVLKTQFGSYFSDPDTLTLDGISRSITMAVTKDGSFYDIDVVFEYSGNVSYTDLTADRTEAFDYTENSSARISAADAVPAGKPIFSVYLLFCAYYCDTDTITINNLAGGDFNVFLADVSDCPTVPSTYYAKILYKSQYDNTVQRVFSNIDPSKTVYRAFNYYSPAFYKTLQTSGYLVETNAKSREFSVKVSLYKSGGGFVGDPIVSLDSNKLD